MCVIVPGCIKIGLLCSTYFDTRVNSVKQLWTNINHLLSTNTKQRTQIQKLTVNNKVITNPKDIGNSLNNYFCSVGESLAASLKTDNLDDFSKYCPLTSKDSMYCETIHSDEITRIIANFPNKKSPGLDGFTPKLLKEVGNDVVHPLTYIFNLSFSKGVVPDYLKQSKVIPLYKKGNRDVPGNYRPISLLSIFDKIMEKLMYNRLYSYLNNKKFFYSYQFGFRKKYSTTLALIEVIDNIYSHIDKHEFTIGIYLDLQKAFDSVNHEILLKKLYNNGVRGEVHAWFQSYLTDRKQTTLHSGCYSDFETATCGVPQGSVLGPLLFLIYINDIQYAATDAKIRLFADDTNLFFHGKSLSDLESIANNTLKQLAQWMAANKLSINIDKTCYSIFGPKNKAKTEIKLLVNNITIKNVNSSKYLGVIIDSKLTWQDHIDYVYNKLLKFVSIFYKIRDQVNMDVLKMIYFSFVHPHILYSIEIYGNTYQTYLSKLITLNNKLLRILQNQPIRTPVGNLYRIFIIQYITITTHA